MKNKFRLWLNIVTICLCVCAIAIGVYSATTATLNVSGKVGFTAHDCSVVITGFSIDNSSRENGATESTTLNTYYEGETEKTIPAEGIPVSGTTPVAFNMGKFYFVDDLVQNKVPDIVITFNIHNTSAYPVTATMTETISSNDKYEDITLLGGTWTKTFGANDNKAGGYDENTLSITLRLSNPATADLSEATLGEMFSVEFNKDIGAHAEGEMYIGEDNRLYVEYGFFPEDEETVSITKVSGGTSDNTSMYGVNRGKPIRWVAYSADGTTALTNVTEIPTSGNLYFVSEYAFDAYVFNSVTDKPVQGKNPNDYAYSEIHTYLNDGFVSKYKLEGLLNAVEPRNLPSEDISSIVTDAEYPNGNKAMDIDEQANLWLLSTTERSLVTTVMGTDGIAYYPSQTDQVYNASFTEYGVIWWLRSPIADYYYHAGCVHGGGYVLHRSVVSECALRPAFQINLG